MRGRKQNGSIIFENFRNEFALEGLIGGQQYLLPLFLCPFLKKEKNKNTKK